jgi:hypothetical protein
VEGARAVGGVLAALVRKELIRPDRPQLVGDGFRFRHILIRDTAYDALPKAAVAIGEGTDCLNWQGDAYADLAEVLQLSSKADEASAALEQPLERYERKGNLVMARRTRDRLAAAAAHA